MGKMWLQISSVTKKKMGPWGASLDGQKMLVIKVQLYFFFTISPLIYIWNFFKQVFLPLIINEHYLLDVPLSSPLWLLEVKAKHISHR